MSGCLGFSRFFIDDLGKEWSILVHRSVMRCLGVYKKGVYTVYVCTKEKFSFTKKSTYSKVQPLSMLIIIYGFRFAKFFLSAEKKNRGCIQRNPHLARFIGIIKIHRVSVYRSISDQKENKLVNLDFDF